MLDNLHTLKWTKCVAKKETNKNAREIQDEKEMLDGERSQHEWKKKTEKTRKSNFKMISFSQFFFPATCSAAKAFLSFFKIAGKTHDWEKKIVRIYDWREFTSFQWRELGQRRQQRKPQKKCHWLHVQFEHFWNDWMCGAIKRDVQIYYAFVHTFEAICSSSPLQGEIVNGAEVHVSHCIRMKHEEQCRT